MPLTLFQAPVAARPPSKDVPAKQSLFLPTYVLLTIPPANTPSPAHIRFILWLLPCASP
jgi:hypothetical protein